MPFPPTDATSPPRPSKHPILGAWAAASGLLLWLVLGTLPVAAGERVSILIQDSPLAGSQYYALSALWLQIKPGDRLTLTREAENRHDRNAIRVDWNGQQLGYIPRSENRAIAQALDRGEKLEARVTRLRDTTDPWRRVEFAVYLIL